MKESMQEVIELYLESEEEIPDELIGPVEFEFKYNIPSVFNQSGECLRISTNPNGKLLIPYTKASLNYSWSRVVVGL